MTLSRRQLLVASLALPASLNAQAATRRGARIIVVGAGFGGATCAKYLRVLLPDAEITLIDRRARFYTGPFTNLVIAGLRTPHSIERSLTDIAVEHRVKLIVDEVTAIDTAKLTVSTARHGVHRADRIVISPGIAMRWDAIAGLDPTRSAQMPHAWTGDAQLLRLRDRVAQLGDGATVLIAAPPNPYRCPPGPYERASLIAAALTRAGRQRCKILVADAKDDFSKRALFELEWDRLYPGLIEWIPRAGNGEVVRVDTASNQVWTRDASAPIEVDLASIIPPQRAADLAVQNDLVDESGWCPIDPASFESRRHAGIHVIGDAALAAPMPKSGFSANSQAKLCAASIAAALSGRPAPDPQLLNTCYSLVGENAAISVSGFYGAINGRLSAISEGMSPLSGDVALREREARQAHAWYDSITADSFGAAPRG
jgi:sulfide dehydrogenase [flavocytochrome c] flavoprotein subunit